MGLIFFWKARN